MGKHNIDHRVDHHGGTTKHTVGQAVAPVARARRMVTPLLMAGLLAACSTSPTDTPSSPSPAPEAERPSSVCIPTGDGSGKNFGPAYRCAADGVDDGRTETVALADDFQFVSNDPITGWMDLVRMRALTTEQLASHGLDDDVQVPGNVSTTAACLWDGGSLTCVGSDYPAGFTLAFGLDGRYIRAEPIGENPGSTEGIPEELTAAEARDFLSDYAVWSYDERLQNGPWS